jgi:predicted Rossmann fold nucleotide-binding protein DprA/Smf involved in DNA uptake
MTPRKVTLPAALQSRLGENAPEHFAAVGDTGLLDGPLLGFVSSRACPGRVLIETLGQVPKWVGENRIILSGFHAPLEQQVLKSVLRRKGRVVKLMARVLPVEKNFRANPIEAEAIDSGRMLLLSACSPSGNRVTRASALIRTRLVLALSSDMVVPHVSTGSALIKLLEEFGIARTQSLDN